MFSHEDLKAHKSKYPHAYYSTDLDASSRSGVHNTATAISHLIRKQEFQLWANLLPGKDDDFALAIYNARRLTGKTERFVEGAFHAMLRMTELPVLSELQGITHRLDLPRLMAIDDALCRTADDGVLAEIDRRLALYLMPTKPHQLLPTAGLIRRRIHDWIALLQPEKDLSDKTEPKPVPKLNVYHGQDGQSVLELEAATEVTNIIERAINDRVKEVGCTEGEALRDLVLGDATVTLNVYRAHDVKNAPAYIFGVGWVDPELSDTLASQATRVRDMDTVAGKHAPSYKTPADIRAYVVGRDGVCRGPGHNATAENAQMDHVVDFADGGATCADNLESLCAHCHNIKTDGRMMPILMPGGDIYWLFEDGTWTSNEPEGPLSRKAKNWVQTFGQRSANRRENLEAPDKPDEPEEEPPF